MNTEMLDAKIKESGKKFGYLAKKCGLSMGGFYNCRLNKAEFKASQIKILSDELGISPKEQQAIFFGNVDA